MNNRFGSVTFNAGFETAHIFRFSTISSSLHSFRVVLYQCDANSRALLLAELALLFRGFLVIKKDKTVSKECQQENTA